MILISIKFMIIFDNTLSETKAKSADVLLKFDHNFEQNEDRVTVFLK